MSRLQYPSPTPSFTDHGLAVHRWGGLASQAPPVILIHGFGSNTLFNWVKTGWLDPLATVSSAVVAVDLPGHGAARASNAEGLRTADLVSDLASVAESLGQPVALHGYSLGARLSWDVAAHYPDAVRSLILGGAAAEDRLRGVSPAEVRTWAREGSAVQDPATHHLLTAAMALPEQHAAHMVELLVAVAADPWHAAASIPRCPTVVIAGDRDEIAHGSEQLASLVRDQGAPARHVAVAGRNHINALTSHDYKDTVVSFLQQQAEPGHAE